MQNDDMDRSVLARHKRWADGLGLIWVVIAMGVFVGGYLLMDAMEVAPQDRLQGYILLSTILILAGVWQVAGLAVARLEILLRAR